MKDKILLIGHDEQQDEKTLMESLKADYDCVLLASGTEGVSYLSESSEQVGLIILDFEEILKDHYKVLEELQDHYAYKSIPILPIALPEQADEITHLFEMGADDILFKPVNLDIARKRVQNLLDIGRVRGVHNIMEDLIRSEIDANIDSLGICSCLKCRRDLLTLTLNNVKPQYVTTEKGSAIITAGRLASMDDRIHLLADIARYAKIIGASPRHD
ncbi:MAG: late competence development ComFB family protein [Roseburia sp.]|nr:late competence development ComFB family protein [Roseburia sp.]